MIKVKDEPRASIEGGCGIADGDGGAAEIGVNGTAQDVITGSVVEKSIHEASCRSVAETLFGFTSKREFCVLWINLSLCFTWWDHYSIPFCVLWIFQFDVAVTKAHGIERGISAVWGEMNASRSVLAAPIDDRLRNPVIVLLSTGGRNGGRYQGSDYAAS